MSKALLISSDLQQQVSVGYTCTQTSHYTTNKPTISNKYLNIFFFLSLWLRFHSFCSCTNVRLSLNYTPAKLLFPFYNFLKGGLSGYDGSSQWKENTTICSRADVHKLQPHPRRVFFWLGEKADRHFPSHSPNLIYVFFLLLLSLSLPSKIICQWEHQEWVVSILLDFCPYSLKIVCNIKL